MRRDTTQSLPVPRPCWLASAPPLRLGAARRCGEHPSRRSGRVHPDLTLPEPHHGPPGILSQLGGMLVPLLCPGDLGLPQAGVRTSEAPPAVCWAAVPEVTVDKDSYATAWKYQVRGAAVGKLAVEAEPRPCGMQRTPQKQLRFGVLAAASTKALARRGRDPLLRHGTQSSTDSAAPPTSPGSSARVPPPDTERGPLARSASAGRTQPRRRH